MSDAKSIEFLVDATPQECLSRAEAYMVQKGYQVETRTEVSITFSRTPFQVGCLEMAFLFLAVFLTLGLFLLVLLVWFASAKVKERVTLVAIPSENGRTQLTIGVSGDIVASPWLAQYGEGPAADARKDLEEWIKKQWPTEPHPTTLDSTDEKQRQPLGQWRTPPPWEN